MNLNEEGLVEILNEPSYDVLTENGWKNIHDINKTDKLACLIDGYLKYECPIYIKKTQYNGYIYNLKTKCIDLSVTGNYNLWISKKSQNFQFDTPMNIFNKHVKYKKNTKLDLEDYVMMDNMDAFIQLYGIWIRYGCMPEPKQTSIRIVCKTELLNLLLNSLINLLLNSLPKYCNDIAVIKLNNVLLPCFKTKRIADWCFKLSQRQSLLLLNTIVGNSRKYYNISEETIDKLSQLCLHAGYACDKIRNTSNKWGISVIKSKLTPNALPIKTNTETLVKGRARIVNINVPGNIFYVRRNGKSFWI